MAEQTVPVYTPNGPKLRYWRKRRGLSCDEVVAKLAKRELIRHPDTIRRAERSGQVGFRVINALAEIYDVEVDELLQRKEAS